MTQIEAVDVETPAIASRERPWIFGLLIAPSAVVANGVIQGGVLSYLLSQQGVSSGRQAHLIWLLGLPTMLYFAWSPITDYWVKRRTWLLIGGVTASLLMFLAFAQKDIASTHAFVLMLLSACCSQLVVSSCGGMMGALRSERSKRVAGSFYQGGSLGFGAAAMSAMVAMSSRTGQRMLGLAAAAFILFPVLFAFAAPEQHELINIPFSETMHRTWIECKATFGRWEAVPYTLCMIFPMASGAAVGLLSGVAKTYGVNGDHVAWINGFWGALAMAVGSLLGARIPARWSAPTVYMAVALINVATLGILWLGPATSMTYYVGVLAYLFTIGTCYAFFTAVVLEFLGDSGKSGSGRYSIINSLGNVPVLYMIAVDGWGGDKWGPRGITGIECVVGGIGATILLTYFLLHPTRKTQIPLAVAG
jgi:PAT family beta-lactamase induction signal transducer AmpG